MIEELLERYFDGETSAAEEKQIRAFFASGEVPEHLAAYAPLFLSLIHISEPTRH